MDLVNPFHSVRMARLMELQSSTNSSGTSVSRGATLQNCDPHNAIVADHRGNQTTTSLRHQNERTSLSRNLDPTIFFASQVTKWDRDDALNDPEPGQPFEYLPNGQIIQGGPVIGTRGLQRFFVHVLISLADDLNPSVVLDVALSEASRSLAK